MTAAYNAIKERGFSVYRAAREYPREYFERQNSWIGRCR
jgi:hypothetical protein